MHLYLPAAGYSVGYRAGRLAGRFYYLALIPVFVIGLGFALASAG